MINYASLAAGGSLVWRHLFLFLNPTSINGATDDVSVRL